MTFYLHLFRNGNCTKSYSRLPVRLSLRMCLLKDIIAGGRGGVQEELAPLGIRFEKPQWSPGAEMGRKRRLLSLKDVVHIFFSHINFPTSRDRFNYCMAGSVSRIRNVIYFVDRKNIILFYRMGKKRPVFEHPEIPQF